MLKHWSPLAALHIVSLILAFQDRDQEEDQTPKKSTDETPAVSTDKPRDASPFHGQKKAQSKFDGEEAIRKVSESFQEAFNEHDAKRLAELFAEDAQIVSAAGHTCRGRQEIEDSFTDYFESNPDATVSVLIDAIRAVSSHLAIEEGTTTTTAREDGPDVLARYTVIYTKDGDDWRVGYARDTTADEAADENIKHLSWLVGDWMDESPDAIVMTSYRWSNNRRCIDGEFHLHSPGYPTMDGTMRIGWDPQARQLRSWIFDSEGGFASGLWSESEDGWLIKITGVMRDGRTTTATNALRRQGTDHLIFSSTDRTLGGFAMPDGEEIGVVRTAPPPEISSKE